MTKLRVSSILALFCVLGNAVALPRGYSDEPKFDLKPLLIDPIRKWSLNTTISFPNSPAFNASTERWTIADPPTYIAAIRPGTEEDIGKVISLLDTGAGHGYSASLEAFQHGLSLDLSQWKTLKIDKKAQTLTVGPGVTFAEIFDPLFKAGFYILSATSHPDLWWGILGAGANFGVITSATYKAHPLANNGKVFIADFYLPVARSREYFDMVEANYSNMSANLAQIMVASWNRTTGSVQLGGNWVYYGPEKEARKELAPVFNLNATSSTRIVRWSEIISSAGFDEFICQPNQPRSLFSLNQKIYSADGYQAGFEKIEKYFYDHPGGRDTTLVFENFPNQAVAAIPDASTAFPWRDFKGFIQINFAWTAGDDATAQASNKLGKELRNQFATTSGYSEKAIFVNYAHGDESIENIYGRRKLPRLAQLKKKYDPSNLFAYNHPLPTHYP
ncbi:hypothetical protein TrVFT333_006195 [Trichoderma virens FT-333]|nr:hypothetical protein TrVFT333_006195 [Trichoderma virens FT-333]